MELIKVSEDVLVNPLRISVVQMRRTKNKSIVEVIVDGRTFTVDSPDGLLADMKRAGVNLSDQFFAG